VPHARQAVSAEKIEQKKEKYIMNAARLKTLPIRKILLAAAMCAQFGAQAAHAGEITLFTDDRFGGREVTLRRETPDLSDLGFNDRASSLVVRSGRWELCADANFRGYCQVFEPGKYPRLEGFNDKLSSARELGGGPPPRRPEAYGRRGHIELFSRPGLRGSSTPLTRNEDNFNDIGFNDRAASVVIDEGTWELCSDANFRGECRVFEPGRYGDLGPGLTGRVSSARLVGGDHDRRDGDRRDDDRRDGDWRR
jgi:hypothetical protein